MGWLRGSERALNLLSIRITVIENPETDDESYRRQNQQLVVTEYGPQTLKHIDIVQ